MGDSRRIVIVGGGVIGLSVAYHLAQLGIDDVLLVERNQLASGTSWHAAGIVGPLRASMSLTRIAARACELFPRLEVDTGQQTGFQQTGGYWLARDPARMRELQRIAAIGELCGLDVSVMTANQLSAREPYLHCDDLAGGLFVNQDGQANPVDICMAYAKGARGAGVEIRENVACTAIDCRDGAVHRVRLSDGTSIRCHKLVNCAGAWAPAIGALAGAPVPLQAVEHMYVVTEPVPDMPQPFPVLRDLEGGIYIKGDAGKLVLGGFEPDAKVWNPLCAEGDHAFVELPEDWDQFEPFMRAGLHRVPVLGDVGVRHFMNGPEAFTPDSRPLLGESPFVKNFFIAAGMNSTGMMSSAGIGLIMARWVVDGEAPGDLWDIDIARFDHRHGDPHYLAQRMREAVADVFAMHWPHKQPGTGRDLRRSPLHAAWQSAGAVFGAPAGWERPLWYAADAHERQFLHSYDAQHWWPMAAREASAARDAVAVFELTPFSKFDVSGKDALALLQQVCANDVDAPTGAVIYGQFLNARGGIEADVTITRDAENAFRVISGAATRWRDLSWLHRQAERLQLRAEITDRTEAEAVLGVMGPNSRALLQGLSSDDFSKAGFAFASSQRVEIAGIELRATRVSFAGELGWELYVTAAEALRLYEAISDAGFAHGMVHAGHLALDACRLEKGFRHWGHDIGPQQTPTQAGLGFAVAWDKTTGFIGRAALLAERDQGVARRLTLFAVDGDAAHPLLLHDEPIYRDGKLVAHTTSGARGFRTDLSLCFAYLPCVRGEQPAALNASIYEIGVAGERYPLKLLSRAPYDPRGKRMRA